MEGTIRKRFISNLFKKKTFFFFQIYFFPPKIACRSEYEPRAKELIEMIALPSLLTLATKYASKLGRIHLAEKLGELLPQFEEQEKEREKYDENEAASELLLSTPTAQNLIRSNQEKNSTTSVVPVCSPYFVMLELL